ncbi:hypothetical protein V8C35DRAFT_310004 [Trichoderma chlorosporum]
MDTTKRTASVSIRNNTSKPIFGVSLLHKYSDVYKHRKAFAAIAAGDVSKETLQVEYNTGFFTTGRDWWLITWYSQDMKTLYYSNPQNYRGTFDAIEQRLTPSPEVVFSAAVVLGPIAFLAGNVLAMPAAAAAIAAAESATDGMFKSEETVGFKQHILREEDEGKVTEIIINDESITFKSPSGDSETVYTSKDAPRR